MRGRGVMTRPRTWRVQIIVQSRAQRFAVAPKQLPVPGESPRTRLRRRSATHVRGRWAGNARPRANPRTLQPIRRRSAHATCGRCPLEPPTVRPLPSVPARLLARRHSAGPSLVPADMPLNESPAGTPQRRPLPVVDLGVPSHLGQVDDILRHRDRVLPRRTRRGVEPAGPSRAGSVSVQGRGSGSNGNAILDPIERERELRTRKTRESAHRQHTVTRTRRADRGRAAAAHASEPATVRECYARANDGVDGDRGVTVRPVHADGHRPGRRFERLLRARSGWRSFGCRSRRAPPVEGPAIPAIGKRRPAADPRGRN